MLEDKVQRTIIGPKEEEETEWRKLRNEEIHNFYYLKGRKVSGVLCRLYQNRW